MKTARLLTAVTLLAAASTPAFAAQEPSDARKAWQHCVAALKAERPDAEFDLKRHTERGTATFRFQVEAYQGEKRERFSCTAHAERGVMKIEMSRA